MSQETTAEGKMEFANFAEFWPFYLSEHMHPASRRWHFAGILTGIIVALGMVAIGRPLLMPLGLIPGYLFAWIGHFGFEKNIPASFTKPYHSLLGDLYVFWRTLTGKIESDYREHHEAIERYCEIARLRKAEKAAARG